MTVSRDQFDETKNWTEPQWQEGVPVMDADLNLAMKIGKTGLRRAVCDFLGNGSPNDGFKLSGLATDPTIHAGNIWVAGLKLELSEDIPTSAQPNAPVILPEGDGIWYLDVIEKLITSATDPAIRDSRLPANVATPIKVWQTDWSLRKVPGATLPTPEPNHYHIGIALEAGGVLTDIRNGGMILAGAATGFQNRAGGRPGSGHRHRDEDIDVSNPNFTGDTLEEALNEIDARIEAVEGDIGVVAPHANTHMAGGADAVSLPGLPGEISPSQHGDLSQSDARMHAAGAIAISGNGVGGHADMEAHATDPSIHGGGGITDHGLLIGIGDDDHTQYLTPQRHEAAPHDHGALAGLDDDDHPQYLKLSEHDAIVHGHGALGGLDDDDHPQYLNDARHDALDHRTILSESPTYPPGDFLKDGVVGFDDYLVFKRVYGKSDADPDWNDDFAQDYWGGPIRYSDCDIAVSPGVPGQDGVIDYEDFKLFKKGYQNIPVNDFLGLEMRAFTVESAGAPVDGNPVSFSGAAPWNLSRGRFGVGVYTFALTLSSAWNVGADKTITLDTSLQNQFFSFLNARALYGAASLTVMVSADTILMTNNSGTRIDPGQVVNITIIGLVNPAL